ncbi:MAG: DUF3667 domain-containing protein [Bacteroidia bacterium]|jgi:hypothetical protein|nr:DUF3667 domain-containing protein [Bacteroidia bacterium]
MAHKLRQNKNCLNCGNIVEEHFCGKCGQENIEPRQTFWELMSHFVEDLTHYEGKFWSTVGYLIKRPGFLTVAYLNGKRNRYLPPVRLYIFISFITFLLPHLIPHPYVEEEAKLHAYQLSRLDSIHTTSKGELSYNSEVGLVFTSAYSNKAELDSTAEAEAKLGTPIEKLDYWRYNKALELKHYTPIQLWEKAIDLFSKGFPKALFIYLPLFAMVILIFHRKSYFFDHGIFTLHYFSFILFTYCVFSIIYSIGEWMEVLLGFSGLLNISSYLSGMLIIWYVYYFYKAHYTINKTDGVWLSIAKGSAIFSINLLLFALIFIILMSITLIMLH